MLDETQRVIYALDQVHFQQHLAHLILMVPNARSFVAEKFKIIVNEQILSLEKDIDLSLSPDEFTFDPDSNAVVYLRSLVKSAAMLELLPQLLQLISQRIIPQLKSISDIYLKQARKNFLRARITHNKFRFTNSRFFDFNFIQKNLIEDNPSSCIVEETLDSLCSDFFGHLLVIATSIVLIGDCVDRIMKSQCTTIDISGSTNSPLFREQRAKLVVDVPSFFRNCISAIQGEVLSFMQSSIQGSTKTSNWSSDQSERSEILNLNEIEDALSAGLEFDKKTKIERRSAQIQFKFSNVSDEDISLPFGLLNTRSVQSEKVEADARKLANLLVCDPFLPSSSNIDHQQVPFEPSINHIPTISTHYTRFNGYLQQLVAQSSSHFKFELDDSIAERYIFTMYHKEFIPLLKNRVITSIMHLFSARDSLRYSYVYPMNPVLAVGSGSGAMLNCVLSSYKVVIGLLRLYHQMPMGREEIEDIISSVFVHIVDGCRSKYRGKCLQVSMIKLVFFHCRDLN